MSEEKQEIKKKKTNNEYWKAKEDTKRKNKISKLEKEIETREDEIKEIKIQMQDENNCTDYKKLEELQEKIKTIEQDIEEKMIEWEELSKQIE